MAYFAIIDNRSDNNPTPIWGWSTLPITREEGEMGGETSIYSLSDTELLQGVAPNVPPGGKAIRLHLTQDQWDSRPTSNPALSNGSIVQINRPSLPLKEQANVALQDIQRQAPMLTAMRETFGSQTRLYVQKLRAIISGADTTSTALPTPPTQVTD
ncbi:hypothetical protein [Saccharibacter sp. EH70]|nr:hypothetical protein [Saccharibacter sp. EH70]MXV35868.1 hypothetical protein [Saccharibacter sp. EH611]MXV57988.1 hypothetical protein [Saccharibacter sp. EH70]MXV66383.1 hypothetical protein [Saccharibacter sp. EH60]